MKRLDSGELEIAADSSRNPLSPLSAHRALSCLLAIFAFVAGMPQPALAQSPLAPPLRRAWTVEANEQADSLALNETTIFRGDFYSYAAYDRATGKHLWHTKLNKPQFGTEMVLFQNTLYVAVGNGSLAACDPRTGKVQWSIPLKTYALPFTVTEDTIYVTLQSHRLSALDRRTRRVRWTIPLPSTNKKSGNSLSCSPQIHGSRIFLTMARYILALEKSTGRLLWKLPLPQDYAAGVAGQTLDNAGAKMFVSLPDGRLLAIHTTSGKILWQFQAIKGFSAPLFAGGRVFAMADDGWLYAVHATTGKLSWKMRLSREYAPDMKSPVLSSRQILTAVDDTLYALTQEGILLWKWKVVNGGIDSLPLYRTKDGVVISDSHSLHYFRHGKLPALPEAPVACRTLAERLIARSYNLSHEERATLTELGEMVFEILLPKLVSALQKRHEALARTTSRRHRDLDFGISAIVYAMTPVIKPKHTEAVLTALFPGEEPGEVVEMLANHGDPAQTIPLFLDIVKRGPITEVTDGDTTRLMIRRAALEVLGSSSDPRAVAYLIEQLGNPDAPFDERSTAYSNMARTGGAAGLKAVLAARDTNRELPSLAQMMALDSLPIAVPKEQRHSGTRLLTTARDDNGVLWGLIQSPALGGEADLWIAHHDGEKWTQPVFTGVNPEARPLVKISPKSSASILDPKTILFAGLTEQDLIEDGGWFRVFIGNLELTRDSDGDGWTDVVERRIGTDPTRTDTDGDGLLDSRDSNPLTAPRALTEEEAVLAATFESPMSLEETAYGWQPLVIVLPQGVKPFEIRGRFGICLPVITKPELLRTTSDFSRNASVSNLYGQGMGMVEFAPPLYDLEGAGYHTRRNGPVILWNADRTEAKVGVSLYYGPLAGTGYELHLKKFNGVWVVIRQRVAYMS